MTPLLGWIVATFLAGAIGGVVAAVAFLQRHPELLLGVTPPPLIRLETPEARAAVPVEPKPQVHEPPSMEEEAEIRINDDVRRAMIQDFMDQDGVSLAKATEAVDQLQKRLTMMGAQGGW